LLTQGVKFLHVAFPHTRNFTVFIFTDANMNAASIVHSKGWKRWFRIERSDSLHLPVLSLLCVWAEHLTTRTQRGQAIWTPVRPASIKDWTSGNETRTQNACASVPTRIVSYSHTVIVPCSLQYCTMFL